MLPGITSQLELEVAEQSVSAAVHKTFDWDFDVGDFKLVNGMPIEVVGLDYLKIWVRKALATVKDRFAIYADTGYGSEHQSLLGDSVSWDFVKSEYERMIQEALLINDAITYVDNFSFEQPGSMLTIGFELGSIYGTMSEAVTI